MSTPRYPRVKDKETWENLEKVNPEKVGKRLKEAIGAAAANARIMTLESQAKWLGITKKTLERWYRGDNLPSIEQLYAIGQRTDVSVDWLLEFVVPRDRDERAKIGSISAEMASIMERRQPPEAFEPALRFVAFSRLAEALVDEFWRSRLLERARNAASKFRELAYEVQKTRPRLGEPDAATEASDAVNQILWQVARLESPSVDWHDMACMAFPSKALQRVILPGRSSYSSPFPVVAGFAFLWHGSKRDTAVYLEPGPEIAGSVGVVRVREGTKRTPRFLVERGRIPAVPRKKRSSKR